MKLKEALNVLADIHTRDNDFAGFTVHMCSSTFNAPWRTGSDYVEAWKTVRKHLGRNVDPAREDER